MARLVLETDDQALRRYRNRLTVQLTLAVGGFAAGILESSAFVFLFMMPLLFWLANQLHGAQRILDDSRPPS